MEYKIYPFTQLIIGEGFENIAEILNTVDKKVTKNTSIRLHESYRVKGSILLINILITNH